MTRHLHHPDPPVSFWESFDPKCRASKLAAALLRRIMIEHVMRKVGK